MDLLKKIINLRAWGFFAVLAQIGFLNYIGKLTSGDYVIVLLADIAAFVAGDAWEQYKAADLQVQVAKLNYNGVKSERLEAMLGPDKGI